MSEYFSIINLKQHQQSMSTPTFTFFVVQIVENRWKTKKRYLISWFESRVNNYYSFRINFHKNAFQVYCKLSFQNELNQNELFIDFKSISSHKS